MSGLVRRSTRGMMRRCGCWRNAGGTAGTEPGEAVAPGLIDVARGRHTNPARIPVGRFGPLVLQAAIMDADNEAKVGPCGADRGQSRPGCPVRRPEPVAAQDLASRQCALVR